MYAEDVIARKVASYHDIAVHLYLVVGIAARGGTVGGECGVIDERDALVAGLNRVDHLKLYGGNVVAQRTEGVPLGLTLKAIDACKMKLYNTETDGDVIMLTDGQAVTFQKEK